MGKRDMTSAKAKEALLKDKDKYCGECCWFYAEDTYGFGACPFQFAEVRACDRPCNSKENFVSKEEMEHHMEVLLQAVRRYISFYGNGDEVTDAIEFAHKYMKVFSNL